MTIQETLFGLESDFLSHTLENATNNIKQRSVQLADGTSIILHALGILELVPANNNATAQPPKLILSAGIHGNETAPIEFCNTLVNEVIEGSPSASIESIDTKRNRRLTFSRRP